MTLLLPAALRVAGPRIAVRLLFFFTFFTGVSALHAQELSFLAGGAGLPNLRSSSFSWDLDYRQHLGENFSASVGWVNEGHIIGHHRDGTAGQLWGELPLFKGRFTISAGLGAYYYFDTQPLGNGDSADVHGTGPIYSMAATAYVSNRVFVRLLINRINPHNDFHSNTALLGVGYWFGQDKRPLPGKLGGAPADARFVTGNEFTVFGGESVVNAFFSEHGIAYAAEYRRGVARHLDATAEFIYEGDPQITRRSGVGLQLWPVNTFFNGRVSVGMGLGAYVYIDNKHLGPTRKLPAGVSVNTPAMAPLISPTFAFRISDQWSTRFVWHRVLTNYNRDSDVFLIGLGYCWR